MSIDNIIAKMTLEEKIGQLFQVGFSDSCPNNEIKDLIRNHYVGGVIYFSRNLKNLKQTAELSNELQKLAMDTKMGIPLFISTDQEGGIVTRLKGGTHFPGNMALGAAGSKTLSKKAGQAAAKELKNIGINMNLAPVLDVNNNSENPVIGVRSFGEDPELVASLGTSYFAGLQSEGVVSCGKHFPGHGDTELDSHLSLPIIRHNRDRLNKVELVPFKKAIAKGIDSIMTAHIYFPAIEKEIGVPATLSKGIITGMLRKELDFNGVIITDCMEMNAISNSYGTVEGAVRSFIAGTDIILISHSYKKQKKAIKALKMAVKSNRITEKRINDSVRRILVLKKKRIGINFNNFKIADHRKINYNLNQKIAEKISKASVTLVKDEDNIPIHDIKDQKISIINFGLKKETLVESAREKNDFLIDYLNKNITNFHYLDYEDKESISKKDEKKLKNSDYIIIFSAKRSSENQELKIAEKLAENNKVIMVDLKNPYIYKHIKNIQSFLTAYDYSPSNKKAAVDVILGKTKPGGQIPIKIRNDADEK